MKPIIFCIVGESGSGKTMIAGAIERYTGIEMIQSYTDRPKRYPNETGHTFLSKEEFDKLNPDDFIAYTQWGEYRYCCLTSDVADVNLYVIDEFGLQMLREKYSDKYHIVAIRLVRDRYDRIASVGLERVERDRGKFTLPYESYDKVAYNYSDDKRNVLYEVWSFIRETLQKRLEFAIGMESELKD